MTNTLKHSNSVGGDDLERAIDTALAKYAAVEPRAGLEERVLANLRAERAYSPDRNWWFWSTAAALAVVVGVAVTALLWRSERPSPPTIAARPPIARPVPLLPTVQTASSAARNTSHPKDRAPLRRASVHHAHPAVVAARPKLDQFPSPQPLSKEELELVRYVQSFPSEATLMAQAQQEFELEIQKEMDNAGSDSRTPGSIQEER